MTGIHIELKITAVPFEGWIPCFKAYMADMSSDVPIRKIVSGPNGLSKEAFEKTVAAALHEIKAQAIRRFDEFTL